jgi:hypothetical protein
MLSRLYDLVFGCTHRNYSFPRTAKGAARRIQAASLTGTYVVCLDCGKEFAYDWQGMRIVTPNSFGTPATEARSLATKNAA